MLSDVGGWWVNKCSGRPIFIFFIKENWICAMMRHHVQPKKSVKNAYFLKVTGKGFANNKAFWNTVIPFRTNKGILTSETIAIENKGKIVTDKSK